MRPIQPHRLSDVRSKAIRCESAVELIYGVLLPKGTRVSPIITELLSNLREYAESPWTR